MGGFKSNSDNWFRNESRVLKRTGRTIVQVILQRGTIIAPIKSGDLVESGEVVDNQDGSWSVVFGGKKAPYGRIQELGGMTGRNHQTKIVGKHYLQTAGDSVAKENPKKYVELSR